MTSEYVELCQNGQLRFSIHTLPWQWASRTLDILDDLRHYVELSTGSRPSVGEEAPVALVLEADPRMDLEPEEFLVNARPERVDVKCRTIKGLSHAVYWLLETAADIRWLWPGPDGEVVPKKKDMRLAVGEYRQKPDYAWRKIGLDGAIYQAMDYSTRMFGSMDLPPSYRQDFELWCRRNRLGGMRITDGHQWSGIAPLEKYAADHPEYFALLDDERDCKPRDGKHNNQPCMTHPDVIDLLAEYAQARFEAEPLLDGMTVGLNDSGRCCECAECRKVDAEAGADGVESVGGFDDMVREAGAATTARPKSVTDRLFWHTARIAEKVRKTNPDKLLLTHLYSEYRRPPVKFDMPDNVIGQYCVQAANFWNEESHNNEVTWINEMSGHVPKLGIYEYYSNGAWPEAHRLFPELVSRSVREYHEAGARYFATQPTMGFAANGLNLYVLTRCLWDVGTNVEDVIDDYCRNGFGKAAEAVKRFFAAFADRWRETRSSTDLPHDVPRYCFIVGHLYSAGFLADRKAELDEATAAADSDEARRRVHFLQLGLEHTRLYSELCRSTIAVYEKAEAGADGKTNIPETDEVRELARQSVGCWDAYWDFVREHTGKYVFGEYWVHYRTGSYGRSDPVQAKIRNLAEGAKDKHVAYPVWLPPVGPEAK